MSETKLQMVDLAENVVQSLNAGKRDQEDTKKLL